MKEKPDNIISRSEAKAYEIMGYVKYYRDGMAWEIRRRRKLEKIANELLQRYDAAMTWLIKYDSDHPEAEFDLLEKSVKEYEQRIKDGHFWDTEKGKARR